MDDVDPAAHVALALDVAELDAAKRLIEATRADVGVFKVGLELFTAAGPAAVEAVTASGAKCFLDLKLHDIPETMGRAVAAASSMGATYLTVHAAAGPESLIAARQRAGAMLLLAVTVLTSLDDAALRTIGLMDGARNTVDRLAGLAWSAGLRGFVSSAQESRILRRRFGADAFLVTPGIRPDGFAKDDQKRVTTPAKAIEMGADLLVVGRPIRNATDPAAAAARIANMVRRALSR
jgi:orotidine-5'-phosphate decarboxylase